MHCMKGAHDASPFCCWVFLSGGKNGRDSDWRTGNLTVSVPAMNWKQVAPWMVPVAALSFVGCQKKESTTSTDEKTPVVEKAKEAVKEVLEKIEPDKSPEERAAKLGFYARLPKDTESVFTIYQGAKIVDLLESSEFGKTLKELAAEEEGSDASAPDGEEGAGHGAGAGGAPLKKAEKVAEKTEVPALLAEEVFLVLGKNAGSQFGNLLRFQKQVSYLQGKSMVKSAAGVVKSGNYDQLESALAGDEAQLQAMFKDPTWIRNLSVPPVMVGFRVSDAEKRKEAFQQLASVNEMIGSMGMLQPLELERAGSKFTGYKLMGTTIAEQLGVMPPSLEGKVDSAQWAAMIDAIKTKNLVILSGEVDGCVLFFLGGSEDELRFAETPKDSLVASKDFKFVDSYLGKDLVGVSYGAKAMYEAISKENEGVASLLKGVRDAIGETDAFGDTREIAALLDVTVEKEGLLYKLVKDDTLGALAYLEEGVKVETFGGQDPQYLGKEPHRLSGVGSGANVAFFANWASNPAYDKAAGEYFESLFETAYALTGKASALKVEDSEDFAKFQEGFGFFDSKLRPDMVKMWDALRGNLAAGLGDEAALVVDFNGTVPPIPKVPENVVKQGKFPRATYIAPVTDRAKVAASWTEIKSAAENMCKTATSVIGSEVTLPQPMSSEKNGLVSWFFSIPFQTDDFVPSVTLNDQWFLASTSRLHALEVVAKAGSQSSTVSGLVMRADLDAFRNYGVQWLDLVDANATQLFAGNESELAEFKEMKPRISKVLGSLRSADELLIHDRTEGGQKRVSVHYKVR